MIKVLWLCNIVLPDFSREFGIRENPFGGWMTGMLHELEKRNDVDVCLCFPIIDKNRLRDGEYNGHEYYTFLCDMNAYTYSFDMVEIFRQILKTSMPNVVHIWGTEYSHTAAMLNSCADKGILDRAVINIQGLMSSCAKHYLSGIPEEYLKLKIGEGMSLEEEKMLFEEHGRCEVNSIKMAKHVIGRTDWDRACVEAINPMINYHFCDEILRDMFYEKAGTWRYEKCQKNSIFISQASYPIKGFHYFLEALSVVIKKVPDTQVYVAGLDILAAVDENPYALFLYKLIKRYELENCIFFLGNLNVEQMIQQYRRANVFVCPSTIENSPNSLKEARIIGVPSVISYVGGSYSKIIFGEDGYLYPYNEPNLLAYYICQIFENKSNVCTKFSRNSVKAVLDQNDPKRTAECTVKIYEKIIN